MIRCFFASAMLTLVETVLPAECLVCEGPLGEHRGGVCDACWGEIEREGMGVRLAPQRHLVSITALGPYRGRLRRVIRLLKLMDRPELSSPLGDLMARVVPRPSRQFDLVTPVPLHRWRRWRRGYNQAGLVAARIARALGAPLEQRALSRRRATSSQRGLTRRERVTNVRGSMAAVRERVGGRRMLLVDDVVTTGATLRECARALKAAGAEEIHALVAARTPAEFTVRSNRKGSQT